MRSTAWQDRDRESHRSLGLAGVDDTIFEGQHTVFIGATGEQAFLIEPWRTRNAS